jgi:hypothetical protein
MRRSHRIAVTLAALCGGILIARELTGAFSTPPSGPRAIREQTSPAGATVSGAGEARAAGETIDEREHEPGGVYLDLGTNPTRVGEEAEGLPPRAKTRNEPARDSVEGDAWTSPHGGASDGEAPVAAPRLDPPRITAGSVTATVSGFDPGSPRRLTLWRLDGESAARLAEAESEPSGRFRFPEVAATGAELVVAVAGEEPKPSPARIRLPGPAVPAAVAEVLAEPDGARMLRIWPSAAAESVIVAASGQELARLRVPLRPTARERALALHLELPPAGGTLWIAEERADGERSTWRRLDLAPDDVAAMEEPP